MVAFLKSSRAVNRSRPASVVYCDEYHFFYLLVTGNVADI